MFSIRKRWPFLAAAVGASYYLLNSYSISGLEHLKIEPVASSTSSIPDRTASNGLESSVPGTFDLTQFNIQGPSSTSAESWGGVPQDRSQSQSAWDHLLSAGEKLALWQGKLAPSTSQEPTSAGSYPGPSLSVSSPIPAPMGLAPPSSGNGSSIDLHLLPHDQPANSLYTAAPGNAVLLPPKGPQAAEIASTAGTPPLAGAGDPSLPSPFAEASIRVATFKVPAMGPATLANPHTLQTLVAILRHFDLVALQGIQTTRDDILPMLVEQLNLAGGGYDYLIGPRVGRSDRQQFAILFNTRKLETDRYQLYTVDDPQDLVTYEPLVAWFRCKGVPPQEAFTFSLVDISVDTSFADAERRLLPNMIAAIEKDGRNEDDWILAGDFAGGPAELTMLESNRVRFAVRDLPTDVAGTQSRDAILFSSQATAEFTGRAGVFDFLRKYNLSIEKALEVSSRLPVWAEFACLEGAQPGRVAPLDPQTVY